MKAWSSEVSESPVCYLIIYGHKEAYFYHDTFTLNALMGWDV